MSLHAQSFMSPKSCDSPHDRAALSVSIFLCVGLVVSYLPQRRLQCLVPPSWCSLFHFKPAQPHPATVGRHTVLPIDCVAQLDNILEHTPLYFTCSCTLQSTGSCLESLMGVIQIAFQWSGFSLVFILFLIYFPEHRKRAPHLPHSLHLDLPGSYTRSEEWRLSLGVAITCVTHLVTCLVVSAYLLIFVGGPENGPTEYWADFLGVSSMILAAFQYLPQIWKTWKRKSVGALSIPMMMLQTPGAALFVYSLVSRPGINWTSWVTYAVTGMLQGILLVMCIVWHFRAKKLGVDDIHAAPGTDPAVDESEQPTERSRLLRNETRT
ncbi:hypothetical protein BC937DRAFT_92315 [Endogone sp. FLAS-F59071]|nr:hypothetical protein BC937DRAFT_92315 [Endogone sp. FLAS-F59071]|eukprot:RUS23101.1 hypothetical protein BC937DRAFT_92315 [Endogone sp. FLAS-F59071]